MEKTFEYNLAGRPFKVVIGKVAEQANGECFIYYGDTVVLVTATASKEAKDGIDFFPLSVDYEEKMYAVGKLPGGFIKREGRPSEKATLTARLIDRPIRPLFPEGFRNSVQVIATVFSVEQDCPPEIAAMIGSSIALSISNIPFNGPTASVHVGYIDGNYIINPDVEQRAKSKIDLTVSGTKDAIMMVEAGSDIVSEDEMLGAILFAHEEIKKICQFIEGIIAEFGQEKMTYTVAEPNQEIYNKVYNFANELLMDAIHQKTKTEREEAQEAAKEKIYEEFKDDLEEYEKDINEVIDEIIRKEVRVGILNDRRPDDRAMDEIRPLSAEVGILPRTHGSGLFKRGQTQVLSVATLAGLSEVQIIDGLGDDTPKRYIHHYNFPPYCVGDTRPMRSPGRREIGHGALAERALIPVLPTEDEFPYTIRVVSEVLSSNGSSSQASICGSTLSLMDAGVPIKAPVAGIAMGLIKEGQDVKILTDIQGLEDHLGDMDFKVAGTKEGITALQMDIKIDGINKEILEEALLKAKKARMTILETLTNTIDKPREDLSPYAPLIYTIKIKPEKIGEVIGSGGKVINSIIEETNVKIDIEDDGRVSILSQDKDCALAAISRIEEIVKDVEVGETYKGKVKKIVKFGAFVEVLKGREGLLHISNISKDHVKNVEDVLKEGQEVEVKVIGIDQQGKISLSRKELLKDSEDQSEHQ
ncbi:hypothetical protein HMPREF1633_08215 [Tissierellia bacterium S5-A11]|nr:hypothetical protein HMPREF1633_08215 [Tissierellia bacterium S5-A11]